MMIWKLVVIIIVFMSFVVLLTAGLAYNNQQKVATVEAELAATAVAAEHTRQAEFLAQAGDLSAQAVATTAAAATEEFIEAATATAEYYAFQTRNAAQAGSLSAQGTADAVAFQETRTAENSNGTATAVAVATEGAAQLATTQAQYACVDLSNYSFTVSEATPVPQPKPTVVFGSEPDDFVVSSTWVITNIGTCPMENIQLRIGNTDRIFLPGLRLADGSSIRTLNPGETAIVSAYLTDNYKAASTTYENEIDWLRTIVVDNPTNEAQFDLNQPNHPQLRLYLPNGWLTVVTATPTPTATPTHTPIPPPAATSKPAATNTPVPDN